MNRGLHVCVDKAYAFSYSHLQTPINVLSRQAHEAEAAEKGAAHRHESRSDDGQPMDLRPRCEEKIRYLVRKGVDIPNPLTLDIGDEVQVEQISARGVKIYPGCRIYGSQTVIGEGAQIGHEGPATLENCQIGPEVELKGGFFKESVFLDKASMGWGTHVREGCILEEQASGAHCVGLKQTILFPFVTLGSLINFCDCLMAGGTNRRNHSEVGSSYIHFNFTPDGDKTTPSLIGDVPRGVMLDQPPVFLGGQGGMVGPLRVGYGNVVAAGSILRHDLPEENKLVVTKTHKEIITKYTPGRYTDLPRTVFNNLLYLANLTALEEWYIHVRRSFFARQEFGDLLYHGALRKLAMAKEERIKRLKDMAQKALVSAKKDRPDGTAAVQKREFHDALEELPEMFSCRVRPQEVDEERERFLSAFRDHREEGGQGYLEVIKAMPKELSGRGTLWLQRIVEDLCRRAADRMPSLAILGKFSKP